MPLPDVPFDERDFVLPNERGRVLTPDGEPLPGVYAVGWIKRGPTGILGTNKRDAEETVDRLVEDLARRRCPSRRTQVARRSTRCSPSAAGLVTADGWRAIDAHELERGRGGSARASSWRRASSSSRQRAPDAALASSHSGSASATRSPARTGTVNRLAGGAQRAAQRGS